MLSVRRRHTRNACAPALHPACCRDTAVLCHVSCNSLTCVGPVSSNLKALKGMQAAGPLTGQLPYWPGRRMVVSSVWRLRSSQCCRSLEPCRCPSTQHGSAQCMKTSQTAAETRALCMSHPSSQLHTVLGCNTSGSVTASACLAWPRAHAREGSYLKGPTARIPLL